MAAKHVTVTAIVVMLGLLALVLATTAAAAPAADPARGKTLWEASLCAKCHGLQGQGVYAGPRAGDTRTAEQWITQVRTPRSMMPAFKPERVSDQDIRDMNEYMKTLPAVTGFTPPQYPGAATDPEGKKLIFAKRCVACHGENGPVVQFTSTGRTPTAAAVIQQLRTPKNDMPMFSPTQVSDAEATTIAEFVAQVAAAQPAATPAPTAAPAATPAPTTVTAATPAPATPPAATPAPVAPTTLPRTGELALLPSLAALGALLLGSGLALRRRR